MADCVIHIGTEKTGTSLLQTWLYENERRLSKQGVALSHVANKPNNRKLVTYLQGEIDDFLRTRGVVTATDRSRYFEGFENDFRDEIKYLLKRHNTLVLTSEHFHSRLRTPEQISHLKSLLDPFFSRFRIICYFREQSRVRTSLYSTGLRNQNDRSVEMFQADIRPENHYYNYFEFFRKWENVFGRAALCPRLYESSKLLEQDLRLDFVSAVLPDVNPKRLSFRAQSVNGALSGPAADLFKTINSHRKRFVGRHVDPTPGLVKGALRKGGFLDHDTPVYDPRQRDFFQLFEGSNLDFFERFFGVRENLFPPPEPEFSASAKVPLSYKDLERFISELLSSARFIALTDDEIDQLVFEGACKDFRKRDVVNRSILLLKVAHRARPKDRAIEKQIEQLYIARSELEQLP